MGSIAFVYMTCESVEEAEAVGGLLVESRLAACVNILPGMKSMYWWEGEVQRAEEVVLIAKTTAAMVADLTRQVRDKHSYDVPCVVALEATDGNPDFFAWIRDQVRETAP